MKKIKDFFGIKKPLFFLILILISFFIIGFFIWQGIYLPKTQEAIQEKLFFIKEGQGNEEIAFNLKNEGLIKHHLLFELYIYIRRISGKLQAGVYSLSPSMSISEIANKIIIGDVYTKNITIPEGFTIRQMERRFSETFNREMNFSQFLASDFKDEFNFLETVPKNRGLEGFLFPDTYRFSYLVTEKNIIRAMLRNFDRKLTSEMREEIIKQGKSIYEIIIMASMLEREVKTFEDKKMVSDIFWRRIEVNMPLQVDATIVYFLEKKGLMPEQGWTFYEMRREVGRALVIDSPYNTYLHRGLPIGPISNPGLNSILAAIRPQNNNYWFFLSTPEGKTIFSRTYSEHRIAIDRYLNP